MNETQTLEMLKSLRLFAMADVYEAFLRLGPSDSRTTGELIAEMAEAEWNAKWNRKTERLLKKAQLRIPASLDEIDYSPERNLDKGVLQSLSRMEWVNNGSTILITGATGIGKSFLACALGTEACRFMST
jgi:DNA replication protein DnaC